MGGASSVMQHHSAKDAEEVLIHLLPQQFTMSEELKAAIKEYDFLADGVGLDDATVLSDIIMQEHRDYSFLSSRLLTKSKSQLQRTRRLYTITSSYAGKEKTELLVDLQNQFHGQYGEFLTNIFRTKLECIIAQLESAVCGLGVEEDIIIDVLCTCSTTDFNAIKEICISKSNENLTTEVFSGKLMAGSVLQKFVLRILNGSRHEEGRHQPPSVAFKQAEILMEYKKMADIDGILDTLCSLSRTECEDINRQLFLQQGMNLSAYFESVISSSSAARALTLWTMPPKRSILHALHHAVYGSAYHADDHSVAVCRNVSALDKGEIMSLREDYQRVYGGENSLFTELSWFLKGNILTAVDVYLNAELVDGDFEKNIVACIKEGHLSDLNTKLISLIEEECRVLKHYRDSSETFISQAKMRLLNGIQETPQAIAARNLAVDISVSQVVRSSPAKNSPSKLQILPAVAPVTVSTEEVATEEYDPDAHPTNLVPYLIQLYDAHHPNEAGEIPVTEFWKMILEDVFKYVFTDYDIARLKKKFKADTGEGVSMVAWKEAISYLTVQINIMKSEKKDLWMGLKSLGRNPRYFWLNIRDDMSFWMTEDEAMQYKQCLSMPMEQIPKKWLIPTAYRNLPEESAQAPKVIVSKAKAANKRGRRKTFGELDAPTTASLAKTRVAVDISSPDKAAPTPKGGKEKFDKQVAPISEAGMKTISSKGAPAGAEAPRHDISAALAELGKHSSM